MHQREMDVDLGVDMDVDKIIHEIFIPVLLNKQHVVTL